MKEALISVVVPAYHVEKYLERCIQSILGQSYGNLELLLVYTKSQDRTESLCNALAGLDQRVKCFLCPAQGVSRARNIALEHASGEYIAFVDADDYVEPHYLRQLYQGIQGRDISLCGFDRTDTAEDGTVVKARPELLGRDISYDREPLLADILCNNTVGGYLWNKLLRKSILQRASLRFRPDLSIGEDMVFLTEYMGYVRSGYYSSRICYHYCCNQDSALRRMYSTGVFEESKLSNLKAARYILQALQEDSPVIREAASYRMVRTGLWTLFNLLKCSHFDRELLRQIQEDMTGNVLAYCRNPQSRALEKAAAILARAWPLGFWHMAGIFLRVARKSMIQRYVISGRDSNAGM